MVPMSTTTPPRAKCWKTDEPHRTAAYYLPERVIAAVRAHAAAHGQTLSQVMTAAAEQFLATDRQNTIVSIAPVEGGDAA
jgi:hypothetical protein